MPVQTGKDLLDIFASRFPSAFAEAIAEIEAASRPNQSAIPAFEATRTETQAERSARAESSRLADDPPVLSATEQLLELKAQQSTMSEEEYAAQRQRILDEL